MVPGRRPLLARPSIGRVCSGGQTRVLGRWTAEGSRRRPPELAGGCRFQSNILRKEVIQPQVPLRLPCYDLVPITGFTFGACLSAPATSDAPRFGGLTGGVYKAQEHIHRGMLIRDY